MLISGACPDNFNSIKVRLEQAAAAPVFEAKQFQFHKGAIRTISASKEAKAAADHFNSIKVRLELEFFTLCALFIIHFNSIKVRLEPFLGYRSRLSFLFQFHKGAIRTHRTFAPLSFYLHFNSIKVRLERDFSPFL